MIEVAAMNLTVRLLGILLGMMLFSVVTAQDSSDDEANVLLTIEREWEA